MVMEKSEISELLSQGQKISTKEKFYFGFGVLANTILTGIVALYLTDYYINEILITYELFILANFIFLFWNALNDIVFAYYADRTKHRLGRRIPYIRYGAPLFALSFIYFWFPIPGSFPGNLHAGQALKFFQLLTALLFFDTMLTIVILSIVALPPEMSESTEERASIAIFNTIFGVAGGLSVVIVPTIMSLGLDVFRVFVLIMGAVATVSHIILSYGVKERKELHEGAEEKEKEYNIIREMTQSLKNPTFVSFLIFNFCIVFINTMLLAFIPFFTNIVGMQRDQATLILIIGFLGNAISLPLFLYFTKKVTIRKIIIFTASLCMVGILVLFFVD
ncbi:MAG: MFS transporter, partial [Promethearchaeota archaeon]